MENTQNETGFQSRTLWKVDRAIHQMEQDIDALLHENEELKAQIRELGHAAFLKEQDQFNTMIAGGLMACIGQPSIKSVSPAAVTMLSRIRSMKTLKEIHAYVEEFMTQAKSELEAMPNEETEQ